MAHKKIERNLKIVSMYDDKTKKWTFIALAKMFQITEARVRQIYYSNKQQEVQA